MYQYAAALGADKRAHPSDDVWSILATAEVGDDDGDAGAPERVPARHVLPRAVRGGQRDHAQRDLAGAARVGRAPRRARGPARRPVALGHRHRRGDPVGEPGGRLHAHRHAATPRSAARRSRRATGSRCSSRRRIATSVSSTTRSRFDSAPHAEPPRVVRRRRRALLPGCPPRPARDPHHARRGARRATTGSSSPATSRGRRRDPTRRSRCRSTRCPSACFVVRREPEHTEGGASVETSEFEGRIGRYHWESEPWWPPRPAPPAGAPNVVVVVLDDVGFAQLGCFGSDIETPDHRPARRRRPALHATSTPPRCARRRARACSPAATTTRAAWAASPTSRPGFPGYDARIPRVERVPPRDARAARLRRVRGRQVAPHARRRDAPRRATASRWPLGRGFERFYGFFGGETHQFAPALVHDNHFVHPPRIGRGRATTSPRTSSTARSSSSPTCATSTPTSRSSSTSRPARATRRTRRRRSGSSATAAGSTPGGTCGASRRCARQLASGILPRGHRAVAAARTGCRRGTRSTDDEQRVVRAVHGVLRRLPLAHRPPARPRCSTSSRRPASSTTRCVVAHVRQRRVVGGRRRRLDQRRPRRGTACRAPTRGGARAHRRDRRADASTTTTRGAGPWPATRRSGAGSARCTRAASPTRCIVHWPRGIADPRRACGASTCTRSTSCPPCSRRIGVDRARRRSTGVAQRPLEGVSFAPHVRRRRRARRRTSRSTSRCSAAARIYHDGWKAVDVPPDADRRRPASSRRRGSSTTCAPTRRSATTSRPSEPERLAEHGRRGGGRRPSATRCCRSTTGRSRRSCTSAPTRCAPRQRYVYHPFRAPVPEAVAVNVQDRSHTITAEIDVPAGGAEGVCSSLGSFLGGWALYLLDGRLRYVHNLVGQAASTWSRATRVLAPGAHTVALRYGRDAEQPKLAELLVDGEVVGAARDPAVLAEPVQPHRRRPHVRLRAGAGGERRLRRAVPVHRRARVGRRRGRGPAGRRRRGRGARTRSRASRRRSGHYD